MVLCKPFPSNTHTMFYYFFLYYNQKCINTGTDAKCQCYVTQMYIIYSSQTLALYSLYTNSNFIFVIQVIMHYIFPFDEYKAYDCVILYELSLYNIIIIIRYYINF